MIFLCLKGKDIYHLINWYITNIGKSRNRTADEISYSNGIPNHHEAWTFMSSADMISVIIKLATKMLCGLCSFFSCSFGGGDNPTNYHQDDRCGNPLEYQWQPDKGHILEDEGLGVVVPGVTSNPEQDSISFHCRATTFTPLNRNDNEAPLESQQNLIEQLILL